MVAVTPLVVPQVNVNDDTVLLVGWSAADGSSVAAGSAVCDVETTKAASEVTATADGILVHAATIGSQVKVGAVIGAIGATREAASAYLAALAGPAHLAGGGATPKAKALANQFGISIDAVRQSGVLGTVKESDVQRFRAAQGTMLPPALAKYVEREGPVPPFDIAVASSLRKSTQHLILTSVDMDCRLQAADVAVGEAKAAGRMVSVLHLIIAATARALPAFPRLTTFVHEGALYRYPAVDIAFVVRASDGRLFTPVLRAVNQQSVAQIAKGAQAAAMRALRGTLKAEDLDGAAFTISQVPVPGTTRVVALPSYGQSAILGVSAERSSLELVDGVATATPIVTFTLSYDHALCDGVYAANFLAALVKDLESRRS